MSIKDVEDLRVYRLALELLERIYNVAYRIPHLKLRTQLINSAEALAPLVAEGFARRRSPKEAARFYGMSMAESDETIVHLKKAAILSKRISRIPIVECEALGKEYKGLSKQLNRLVQTWREFSRSTR